MNKFSIVIPIKIESSDRRRNFEEVVRVLTRDYSEAEIVIVGHESNPYSSEFFSDEVNVKYIEGSEKFNKCEYNNLGATHATADVLCFYDADCIVYQKALLQAVEYVANEKYFVYYPFSEFNGLNVIQTSLYFQSPALDDFHRAYIENSFSRFSIIEKQHTYRHPGGVQVISSKIFDAVGGFNTRLKSWGGDDLEMFEKIAVKFGRDKIGYIRDDMPCFHLYHSRPNTSWNESFMDIDKVFAIEYFFRYVDEHAFELYFDRQNIDDVLSQPVLDSLIGLRRNDGVLEELQWNIQKMGNRYTQYFENMHKLSNSFSEFVKLTNNKLYLRMSDLLCDEIRTQEEVDALLTRLIAWFSSEEKRILREKRHFIETMNRDYVEKTKASLEAC